MPEDNVWAYFGQCLTALDACHNGMRKEDGSFTKPLLHRDLKPENIFLDDDDQVKLGDFGLSKQLDGGHSFANTYVGTPFYMSPELATGGSYDVKSDIWALGCVIYELCALAPPFNATSQAELTVKIKSGHVPSLPNGYSPELNHVVRSMLALSPRKRPTARQLLEVPQVKLQLRVLEMTKFNQRLRERELAVAAREESLNEREALLNRTHAYNKFSNDTHDIDFDHRKAELEREEELLRARQIELDERQNELVAGFNRLQLHQREAEAVIAAEVERRLAALAEEGRGLPPAKSAARRPRISDLAAEGASKSSPARPVTRPPVVRRVSGAGDTSFEAPVRRAPRLSGLTSGATTTSGARRRRSNVNSNSPDDTTAAAPTTHDKRTSAASDEWIDAPGDVGGGLDEAVEDAADGGVAASAADTRAAYRRSIRDNSGMPPSMSRETSLTNLRRGLPSHPSGRTGVIARLIERERYNPACDKSDITMKDVTLDDKENDSSSTSLSPTGARLAARARRITLDQQRLEEEEEEAAVAADERILKPSAHDYAEAQVARTSNGSDTAPARNSAGAVAADDPPIYDISNDPDLPSPFLRPSKEKKISLEKILAAKTKPAARHSAAGGSSFAQRTAALRNGATGTTAPPLSGTGPTAARARPSSAAAGGSTTASTAVLKKNPSMSALRGGASGATRPRASNAVLASIPSSGSGAGLGPRRSYAVAGAARD